MSISLLRNIEICLSKSILATVVIALLILVPSIPSFSSPCPDGPGFKIIGHKIFDPDGKEFVPMGCNMNGFNCFWGYGKTIDHVDKLEQCWKFNIIRVVNSLDTTEEKYQGRSKKYHDNDDIDEIIRVYTARKMVVMLDGHDWMGSLPDDADLNTICHWYRKWGMLYKDNPYVWYNLLNEPSDCSVGETPDRPCRRYVDVHRRIIEAIRDEAGADNIIICDGIRMAQDMGTGWGDFGWKPHTSAIICWGDSLKYFNGKTYPNIGFSFHTYGQWIDGDTRMARYIDTVLSLGHSLHIGETGDWANEESAMKHWGKATVSSYRVAIPRGVGIVAWHGMPGDGFALAKPGAASSIDNCENPTNLSWHGELMWPASHNMYNKREHDTQPPSPPANVKLESQKENQATLSWSEATDNEWLTGYDILNNGTEWLAFTTKTTHELTGLSGGKNYSISVTARDMAANKSQPSNLVTFVATGDPVHADFKLHEPAGKRTIVTVTHGTSISFLVHGHTGAVITVCNLQGVTIAKTHMRSSCGKITVPSLGAGVFIVHIKNRHSISSQTVTIHK
jgi:mannan endo-1,4-beta-mannosidase